MYSVELIDSSRIIYANDMVFVFNKSDIPYFTEEHMDTLFAISTDENLRNPVFVTIESDGGLTVD